MSTILSLLAFLVGATAVIAIGTRISLYFYTQDMLEGQPLLARQGQASLPEAQTTLERSGTLYRVEYASASSRYAWIGLAVIASVVLLVILVVIGLLSGIVL